MLVLTRRENEKIIFPDVDISVEVVSISGSRARLGVRAPSDIRILRQEIAGDEAKAPARPARSHSKLQLSHSVRNRLNATSIAAQLLRRQMDHGLYADADETARMLLDELGELNRELVAPPKEPRQENPARAQRRRALLVEDNPNERQLLAGFLKMAGFEVETAGDGEDALEYLKSHELPDVVLLDMLMPRCDGPTAVDRIRRDPALAKTKIFVVSGTAPAKFGLETGPGGIDRWFNKPIDPEQLAREMARDLMTNHQVA